VKKRITKCWIYTL